MKLENYFIASACGLLFLALSSFVLLDGIKFEIKGVSGSKKYGYTEQEPIKVGGGTVAGHHFMFLKHLRGPKGEALEVNRIGSCGTYPNPDTTLTKYDQGVLTCFSINCAAFDKPRILYLISIEPEICICLKT